MTIRKKKVHYSEHFWISQCSKVGLNFYVVGKPNIEGVTCKRCLKFIENEKSK